MKKKKLGKKGILKADLQRHVTSNTRGGGGSHMLSKGGDLRKKDAIGEGRCFVGSRKSN